MPATSQGIPSPRSYALAARRAAKGVAGIARVDGCPCAWLYGAVPGVRVRVVERERLFIEIDLVAQMNQRLEVLGATVRDAVFAELLNQSGLRAVAVDVIFTGIRFDKRALPKPKEYPR